MKIIKLVSFGFIVMLVSCSCWSMLDLRITQANLVATPIAIFNFDSPLVGGVKQSLAQIVADDLSHSGDFAVNYPARGLNSGTGSLMQVNMQYWRQQKINYLLTGKIKTIGPNNYKVTAQLLSVWPNESKGSANVSKTSLGKPSVAAGSVIFSDTFSTDAAGMRAVGHHISDIIYQHITGVKGIFSTKIAYVTVQGQATPQVSYKLNVSDQDGYDEHVLLKSSQPIMSPAWSPDGKSIAYVSFEGRRASIYVQNISTGKRRQVSDYPGINGAPAFSPDGSRLALVLTRTGYPKIFVMDLKTEGLKQITRGYSIDTEPAWSLDGKSIIFTSSRGGSPQIYRYNFANKNIERLTFNGTYNARASFLPGGDGIIMMHRNDGLYGIATQNLSSARVAVLAQSGYDESPSIAPNGRMVIFASQYAGRGVLSIVSLDGKVKLRLPAKQGVVQDPAWSPYLS